MILVLFDRTEIIITKEQAQKVDIFLNSDSKYLRINGYTLTPQAIRLVKPGGYTEVDLPPIERSHRLQADNRPEEEQYSSARQQAESIKDIVKKRDWSKLKKGKRGSKNVRG